MAPRSAPVWQEDGYLNPATGECLPTWEQALDQLDEPQHVIRFGDQLDVKGVLSGTPDADQTIRYLSKYLTKSLGQTPDTQAQRDHAARFVEALRYDPCSPTCPNWLRYGVQPKNARQGMTPGQCRSKAHKPDHLGYAGRRVLVSRKWSNKTLAEHKQDRRTWVLEALGHPDEPTDPHRYLWTPVPAGDANLPPTGCAPPALDPRTAALARTPPPTRTTRSFGNFAARSGSMKKDTDLAVILPATEPHLTPRAAAELLSILLEASQEARPALDAA
ncbi:replication initiator [Nonomuraea typhae]|uniref:Replication initiator n=1 Tax=Nonomuraea typhae TaxID=2603600 RepID=A0ABW7ZAI7_9ACTN